MKTLFLIVTITLSLILIINACSPGPGQQPMQLTALNSMQRVIPSKAVHGKNSIEIKAARNEYEAAQVVITASGENHLQDIKIAVSDLQNDQGKIGKDNIHLYREENVFVRNPSPRAELPPGLYPDPLLPFINPVTGDSIKVHEKLRAPEGDPYRIPHYTALPINIYPGQSCTLWVDVYVPPETGAGVYTGNIKVTAGDGTSASMPVKLTVWNFTLPEKPTHRTHFGEFSLIAKVWGVDRNSDQYKNTEMRFCEELARHRISPPIPHSLLPEVNDDGSLTIDPERHRELQQYIERTRLADFEIPRTKFMTNTSNSDRPTPANQTDSVAIEKSERYYCEMFRYLKDNGWDKRAYLYLIDEPNSDKDYNQVVNLAKVVNEAAPDIRKLVVEQTYTQNPSWPDLDPYIDIWCPLFSFVDRNTVLDKISQGDEVWTYTALVQPAPSYHPEYEKLKDKNPPYWHIDQPVIMYRIPTWLNRQYDITGLLYWTTTGWYNDMGPWIWPTLGPRDSGSPDTSRYDLRYFNGGGMLFYPGKDAGFDGPVASIRLKNIREGLEDYEYFAILDKRGEGAFVKDMVDQICQEWWDFTRDPEKLLEVREKLALKIESLGD